MAMRMNAVDKRKEKVCGNINSLRSKRFRGAKSEERARNGGFD